MSRYPNRFGWHGYRHNDGCTSPLTGAFSNHQGSNLTSQEACASSGSNCCVYDAYCGGPSGPEGYELYPGACSMRDMMMGLR